MFLPSQYRYCMRILRPIDESWEQIGFCMATRAVSNTEDNNTYYNFFVTADYNPVDKEPVTETFIYDKPTETRLITNPFDEQGRKQWLHTRLGTPYDYVMLNYMGVESFGIPEIFLAFLDDLNCTDLKTLKSGQEIIILDRPINKDINTKDLVFREGQIKCTWTNRQGQVDLIQINADLKTSSVGAPVITKDGGYLIGMVANPDKKTLVTTDIIIDVINRWIWRRQTAVW